MIRTGLGTSVVGALVRDVSSELPLGDADEAERVARVAWSCLVEPGDGVAGALIAEAGPQRAYDLLLADCSAGELAEASGGTVGVADAEQGIARWRPRMGTTSIDRAFRQGARFGARLVVPGDPCWPAGLDDLGPHRPILLWVRGRAELLGGLERSIAVIGARAATGYGEHVTVEASAGLVDRGIAVVSGAAYGIDGAGHRAALASNGDTIAVLAGGLDRFYPSGHESLLTRIADRGAVVAEVPCGTAPTRWRFLQRNRIIAAASAATVVVEAGWRSGSLNTAGHASAIGRPLGAVPGPVTSSASAGCHRMLREYGATCVTTAEEMAELLPAFDVADAGGDRPIPREVREADGTRVRVLDALSARSARTVDRIAADSGLALDRVRAELGVLELEGRAGSGFEGWRRIDRPRSDG